MVMSLKFVFDIFLLEHYAPDVHSNNYIEVGLQRATSQMLHLKVIVIYIRITAYHYVDSSKAILCGFYGTYAIFL